MMIAKTPKPPYYAVIFTSILKNVSKEYSVTSDRMVELASKQLGFLGIESARNEIGITVSYWKDEASILKWKANVEHLVAQEKGIKEWYAHFSVRVCKVERAYSFKKK